MIRRLMTAFAQKHATSRSLPMALLTALFVLFGIAPHAAAQSQSGFVYNGIVYTSYQAAEYQETPQGPQGAAVIRATGANYGSVVVTQYEQTSTSNTIAPETTSSPGFNSANDPLSPTDSAVAAAIQNLQAQGITVFLKPQVDSLDGVYRGTFAPTNPTAWFASYQTFILHYAQIASQNNVGGLIIGTELASLSGSAYKANWNAIIAQLRSSYPGLTLAYAANATSAGDEFTTVSFWDKVDIIGVDGYFPLTNHTDPTVAQLVAAWSNNKNGFNALAALQTLQAKYNKPLIFTELGYVSASGTNEAPYASATANATVDPNEQEDCYEAFFEVFSQQSSWMKGVFWWAWNVSPPGANDKGYTPQNKPAATVTLAKWYGSTTQAFTLAPSTSVLTLGQGLSTTDTISVTNLGGFTGAVTLAATGLPSGVSASFTPGTVAGTQVMTITATAAATTGAATVTITGTSGSLTATATIALTVQAATAQTITFTNPGTQTVGIPLTLSATSTSTLPVTLVSSTANVCTISSGTASFASPGTCTITASQTGNAIYTAATPVAQSFTVNALSAVPVPANAEVIVSQVNWLSFLNGNAFASGNPDGSSFAVNSNGNIVLANTNNLLLFNSQTGAVTTLGPWSSASAVAVDSHNNIYVGNLYGPVNSIIKLPYTGVSSNGGYPAFTTPTAATPACTGAGTTECTLANAGSVNPGAMAFDAAGDLFWVTANSGATSGNSLYECSVACLAGTASPVQLYQEPTASTPPSSTSGQLLAGGIAIDPSGNIFFTDSSTYVNPSTFSITSFSSNLKELPVSTGVGYGGQTTGYAPVPSVLYTLTPSSIGTYDNQIDGVAVNASTGTVYFADQNDGVFAFPNSGSTIPIANGRPTALYAVSTQGAKTLGIDAQNNLYFTSYSTVVNSSGGDTLGQVVLGQVAVPTSPTGTPVSPSTTTHPVGTLLNAASCSASPAPSVTFAASPSTTATATVSTTGTCSSTLSGGSAFATNVSFTPTTGGSDSVSLTGTDQAGNTGIVTVHGLGQAPPAAQTITFANPGAQTVGTPLTLVATATSGLPVAFTSATTNVCTVSSTTATFLIAGTCTINANQQGNSSYLAAPQVQQSFTVNVVPSFAIAPSASTVSVVQGATATDTIAVTGANGFSGSVTLAATNLPTGVTAAFTTNPTTNSTTITFSATASATAGPATVTITGSSGSLTATTTIALTVNLSPSFTIAASAPTVSVIQGSNATDTITITGANNFTGSVTLAATNLPTGVTAAFATNPTTGSSVLTLSATASAATGPATVTVTGTSGTLTASTTIALTVKAPPTFTLAPTTPTLSLIQAATATDTITVTPANGFTGSVTLAATGLPSGVTASFATNPATGSSVLTLSATASAATGPATVTITGTSGTLTASTTIALTVNPSPTFTIAASAPTLSIVQGSNATDTITITGANNFTGSVTFSATGLPSGVTASFATNPATGSSVLTFSATASAATGSATVTITGTSGTLTVSTTIAITVNPSPTFTIAPSAAALAVVQGATAIDTITITGANNFTGSVTLAATNLPSGITASFATNPTTGSSVLTLSASASAPPGSATVTITGTSGTLTAAATIALTVNAAPGLVLAPTAPTVSVARGSTVTDTITLSGSGGFTGTVTLSAAVTSAPAGAQNVPTLSFGSTSPVNVTSSGGTATLTISTTAATVGAVTFPTHPRMPWRTGGGVSLACLCLFLLPSRRRRARNILGMFALLAALASGLTGCGGGSPSTPSGSSGTTPGAYVITVTATSGATSSTLPVTLNVQ